VLETRVRKAYEKRVDRERISMMLVPDLGTAPVVRHREMLRRLQAFCETRTALEPHVVVATIDPEGDGARAAAWTHLLQRIAGNDAHAAFRWRVVSWDQVAAAPTGWAPLWGGSPGTSQQQGLQVGGGPGSHAARSPVRAREQVLHLLGRHPLLSDGQTRQEVADKLTDALAARRKGMLVTNGRRSLADWLEQWLSDWVENYVARTTHERYRGIVRRYIVPQLGRKTLEQLSAPRIQRYYSQLNERGFAAATISLHRTVLYHSLRDAKRVGLCGPQCRGGCQEAPRARAGRHASGFHARAARDARKGDSGARPRVSVAGPALDRHTHRRSHCGLTWDDVDLAHARLIVRKSYRRALSGAIISEPKTKRGRRTIPLGQQAVEALQAQRLHTRELRLRALKWQELDLVFPNTWGRYLRADKVLVAFKRVLRSAGLPQHRLHDLRHTYATDLYAADVHPRSFQELLGHSRLDMTNDRYTGSVPDALREAVERLDRSRARQSR
jgi:integrase-like protein